MALAPEHGSTAGALLKRADQAMYEAKQTGRPVRVFDTTLDTASPSRLALVAELRQAITAGDVEVHVQPKVRASAGSSPAPRRSCAGPRRYGAPSLRGTSCPSRSAAA